MSKGYFITGTDTAVGKTRVTLALLRELNKDIKAIGMKPVASGCEKSAEGLRNADAIKLLASSAIEMNYQTINPYAFLQSIAPHIAAAKAGVSIELKVITKAYRELAEQADVILVEGAGGWFLPLGQKLMMPDVIRALQLPVILVVGMRLGAINHALLTVKAIASAGFELTGWILNQIDPELEYLAEIEDILVSKIKAPILGRMAYSGDLELVQSLL